jgi:hypothetical protein
MSFQADMSCQLTNNQWGTTRSLSHTPERYDYRRQKTSTDGRQCLLFRTMGKAQVKGNSDCMQKGSD